MSEAAARIWNHVQRAAVSVAAWKADPVDEYRTVSVALWKYGREHWGWGADEWIECESAAIYIAEALAAAQRTNQQLAPTAEDEDE